MFVRLCADVPTLVRGILRAARKALRLQRVRELYPTVTFQDDVMVEANRYLFVGRRITIGRGSCLDCRGLPGSGTAGFAAIGDDVEVGPNNVWYAASGISIGNHATIGANVVIDARKGMVVIGDHAAVGPNATIEGEVTIAPRATIAGGTSLACDPPSPASTA